MVIRIIAHSEWKTKGEVSVENGQIVLELLQTLWSVQSAQCEA